MARSPGMTAPEIRALRADVQPESAVVWLDCPAPGLEEIGAAAWEKVQHLGLTPQEEAAAMSCYMRLTAAEVEKLPGVVRWCAWAQVVGVFAECADRADDVLREVFLTISAVVEAPRLDWVHAGLADALGIARRNALLAEVDGCS